LKEFIFQAGRAREERRNGGRKEREEGKIKG
jgi:hypothetical protein